MNKTQIHKIDDLLKKIPTNRFPTVINFLSWLKDSDETLSQEEIAEIQDARKEKGGLSWESLKQHA